jgi:hypothetical protein
MHLSIDADSIHALKATKTTKGRLLQRGNPEDGESWIWEDYATRFEVIRIRRRFESSNGDGAMLIETMR